MTQRLTFNACFYGIFRVNDLPTEILNNIFHLVVWSCSDRSSGIFARTRIVSTCRHWRTAAIQDSTLWNVIWFRNPPEFKQAYLWLERSANAALDIRISIDISYPLTGEATAQLINNIFQKISNIRILIIVVDHWDPVLFVLHTLSEVAKRNIPLSLERLEIHHSGTSHLKVRRGFEQEPHHIPVALFGGAKVPSLRYLALNGPGVSVDWEGSMSTLANLTTVDFRRMVFTKVPSLKCFRSILHNSPNLVKLILYAAGPPPVSSDRLFDQSPILLPNLKVLVLGEFSLNYGEYLLSQFSAPNVVELFLMNLNVGEGCTPFFTRLISAMPSVLTLTLNTMLSGISHQEAPAIIKWLQSMPQLTFLRLVRVHQDLLDLFLTDHTQSIVCPKLAYLELHHTPEVGTITSWASTRKELGFPLSKIYIGQDTFESFKTERPEAMQPLIALMRNATSGNVHLLPTGKKPPEEGDLFVNLS